MHESKPVVNENSDHPPYLGFGVGGIGSGLVLQAPGLLLLIYMTDTLAIPAALAGLALFAPRLLDVITDPIMGIISDRTKSKWGRRRPYLLLGAIVTGISACFLFAVPFFDSVYARLAFVTTIYIIVVLGTTIFMVPWIAMPAEMTSSYQKRTKLMSTRSFFSMIGLFLGGVMGPLIVHKAGGGREGYAIMSVILGVFCASAFFATFYGTRKASFKQVNENPLPLKEQLKVVLANRPFKIFISGFILFSTGMGCGATIFPYYIRYIIERPDLLPVLWGASMAASLVSIPVWTRIANKYQKQNCFKLGLMLLTFGCVCFFFVHSGQPLIYSYIAFIIFGLGFSGALVASYAMLPDVIQWDALQSDSDRGGIFSGAMVACDKCGFALGSLVVGSILGWAGYIESSGGDVTQPDRVLFGIKLIIGVVPGILMVSSAMVIRNYSLTEQKLKDRMAAAELETT